MADQPLMALVDCNNFYVSCERVFRPDLIGKPVAVLSNNDGCIVARSQEVKDLGIKMGVPLFQVQQLVYQHQIHLFSSNYSLYADMSSRVMSCLEEFSPRLEVYSIDEAFLDFADLYPCRADPTAYGRIIKDTVFRHTGIPVCVGIGPTKTLAKLANFAAKKWKQTGGVLDLSDPVRREKLMRIVPVKEVWGIGSRTSARLNALNIQTVWDLAKQPSQQIHSQFNITVARTVMELNGVSCLDLEEISPDKQQIVCSRTFSRKLYSLPELSRALSEYCTRAAEKLRNQQSVTGCITIFIRTNPHALQEPQYQRSATVKLDSATQDTRIIIYFALKMLRAVYRIGFGYQKCGVQLSDIKPISTPGQMDLFDLLQNTVTQENRSLMSVLDQVNRRFPKSLSVASSGFDKSWKPKNDRVSQRYTTDWKELVSVT
jgi:DNA polymerase V